MISVCRLCSNQGLCHNSFVGLQMTVKVDSTSDVPVTVSENLEVFIVKDVPARLL